MLRLLTPAVIQVARVQLGHARPRVLANHDPLRNVPRGEFTLDDYSYTRANLCQCEFGNCSIPSLGVA